jgi:hypothetical protein
LRTIILDRKRRADLLNSFTFDNVSQLDQDISTVLADIREWRNSFVRINRTPLDILSLIPTQLVSQKDRFRATFVCRHWRRTFIQQGPLWSQLFLTKGEVYVKTLLERAKGSALDITANHNDSVGATKLTLHTQQIRRIYFAIQPLEGHPKVFGNQLWTASAPAQPHYQRLRRIRASTTPIG